DSAAEQNIPGKGNRSRKRERRERQASRALQPLQNGVALPNVHVGEKSDGHADHAAALVGAAGEHSKQKYSQQRAVSYRGNAEADLNDSVATRESSTRRRSGISGLWRM